MNWFLILIAVPLASLFCFVYIMSRDNADRATHYAHRLAQAILPSRLRSGLSRKGKRSISWVSEQQFRALVRRSDDVILVDLASGRTGETAASKAPNMLFSAPNVLLVEQRGLLDVLEWASSTCSVVLYGPRDVCASTIPAIRKISGLAPVYLLPESPNSSRTGILHNGHGWQPGSLG
jgi:hypothetical protein